MKKSEYKNRKTNGVCNYHQGKENKNEEAAFKKKNLTFLSTRILSSHLSNRQGPSMADGSSVLGKCGGLSNSLLRTSPDNLLGGFKVVELNFEQPPTTICHISAYFGIPGQIMAYCA